MFKSGVVPVFIAFVATVISCSSVEEVGDPAQEHRDLVVADSIVESSVEEGIMIGHIADVCFGPSGEVLVLDQTAACVYAFSREGDFTGMFGGPGSGPGEMGNPMSIETAGNMIIVRDAVKHGYLLFDRSYALLEEVSHWPTASPTDMVFCEDNSFIARTISIEAGDQGMQLRRTVGRYRIGDAETTVTYFSDLTSLNPSRPSDILRMGTESVVFTADSLGNVYLSEISGEDYLVTVFSPRGEILYSIVKNCEPVEKSAEELAEEIRYMEAELRTMGVEGIENWEPEPLKPMIKGLGVDNYMNLWVQRGNESEQVFDIYDAGCAGEPVSSALFPRTGNDWNFRVSPSGMLGWQTDPASGIRTVYVLEATSPIP